MILKDINALVFDFGNVLLDLDPVRCFARMQELTGLKDPIDLVKGEPKFFHQYEVGEISEEIFINSIMKLSPNRFQAKDFLEAWNSMLVALPKHRLDLIIELRKNYKVYLLSNTNFTHIQWVRKYVENHYGISNFEGHFFDKVYYSYEVNLRKPDKAIYQLVMNDLGENRDKALFFDDTEFNVITANQCNFLATLHDPKEEIGHHLRRLELI